MLAVLAGVLLALPSVVVAGLAKTFVNKYLIGGSIQWLDAVLIAFVLAAVLQVGLSALQQAAMTRCSRKMSITMSADYLWHLLRLPISHFVARPAGDLGFLMNLNDKNGDRPRPAADDDVHERRHRADHRGVPGPVQRLADADRPGADGPLRARRPAGVEAAGPDRP